MQLMQKAGAASRQRYKLILHRSQLRLRSNPWPWMQCCERGALLALPLQAMLLTDPFGNRYYLLSAYTMIAVS